MKVVYFKVIDRKTNEVVVIDTMPKLAIRFEVDKTAIFQAERRDSKFLRIYKIVRCSEEEYKEFISKSNE